MSFATVELILWACFALLVWGLRDSIKQVETEIDEQDAIMRSHKIRQRPHFCAPQNLFDPIGRYMDSQIYHYAIIDGKHYQFDHVCPTEMHERISSNERCVAPGLIYVECALTC